MKNKTLAFLGNNRSAGNMVNETFRFRLWSEGHMDKEFHLAGLQNTRYADLIAADAKQPYWIISGHLTYGVHTLLGRDVDYFMNIREAGDRLVSKYRQWGGSTDPEEFLREDFDLDNSVTKRLAGYCLDENDPGYVFNMIKGERTCRVEDFKVTEEIYREACENAKHVPSVIFRDRLPESLVMLEQRYSLPPIFCFRFFNLNRSRRRDNVSDEFMAYIRELNHFDNALFARYDAQFSAQLAEADEQTRTVIEARALAMNAITRIEEAINENTEVASIETVFNLANELFSQGKLILGLEVMYLIVVNLNVRKDFRERLISQVSALPESYAKDKVQNCLHNPHKLSSRWLGES